MGGGSDILLAAEVRLPEPHAALSVAADEWGGFFPFFASMANREEATCLYAVHRLNRYFTSTRCLRQRGQVTGGVWMV